MADLEQPVITKKVKVAEDGHHGGAWKVAYADFVTAMMAFFLLLWLLNATEQEVLDGISNYFTPTTRTSSAPSGSGNVFGGATPNDPGPTDDRRTQSPDASDGTTQGNLNSQEDETGPNDEDSTGSDGAVNAEEEELRFNQARRNLETQLNELPPELQDLKDSIQVDVTEEGLRIQLIDTQDNENFSEGSDELTEHARLAIQLISDIASTLPNPISVTGHTTAEEGGNTQWELSVDRSNAVRRGLMQNGIPERRFDTVVGVGATAPLIPENPSSPRNRRMSVVLLRQAN
ncbi:MAG: flagellar motor protein MotB [Alphaproteobacteria bacterium]